MKVSELFAEIGFKVDKSGLNEFSKSMKNIQETIKNSVSGLKEFAKTTERISKAAEKLRSSFIPSEKDASARFRAVTYYLRSLGKQARGNAESLSGKGAYWSERALYVGDAEKRLQQTADLRREQFEYNKQNKSGKSLIHKFFGTTASSLIAGILAFKAAVSTFEKAAKLFEESIKRAYLYSNFKYVTGLNMEKLTALQNLAERSGTGLSQEDVARDIKSVQENLMAIRYGQGNIAPYKMLGISAYGNDPFTVISQLKESVKHLDNVTASYFLSQIGFSHPDWLRMLKGDIEPRFFDQFTKPTSSEREDTKILGVSWRRFETSIKDLWDRIVSFLSGPVSLILDALSFIVDVFNTIISPIFKGLAYDFGFIEGLLEGFFATVTQKFTELILAVKDLAFWKDLSNPENPFPIGFGVQPKPGLTIIQQPTVQVNSPEDAARYQKEAAAQDYLSYLNNGSLGNSFVQGNYVSA